MDKTLRTVIIVCICVMTFSVFHYFVIYLPNEKAAERAEIAKKEETARAEAERKEKAAGEEEGRKEFEQSQKVSQKKIDYLDCLATAKKAIALFGRKSVKGSKDRLTAHCQRFLLIHWRGV